MMIKMHDGIVRTLTEVMNVLELRNFLISLGSTLDAIGCCYKVDGGVIRVTERSLVMMNGVKKNSLYMLQGSTMTGTAGSTSSSVSDSETTQL